MDEGEISVVVDSSIRRFAVWSSESEVKFGLTLWPSIFPLYLANTTENEC
jgi:hypothetical protein